MNREADLHLHAPEPLKQILDLQFAAADTRLPFTLHFHALKEAGVIVDEDKFSVECFKVYHRIQCWGFIIREKKKPRRIDKEKILQHIIPTTFYENLKEGKDYTTETGEVIKNENVTIANSPIKSYAFCSDTIYNETIADCVKDITLLYHETTYLKDLEERATSRFHCTTEQAANIALLANAKKLIIGHFSSKYEKLDDFLTETKEVFSNTELAVEGVTFIL